MTLFHDGTGEELVRQLNRAFIPIDNSLNTLGNYYPRGALPLRANIGDVIYCKVGVIGAEGLYVYKSSGWTFIV